MQVTEIFKTILNIYEYTMDIVREQGEWLEHNGVTTT